MNLKLRWCDATLDAEVLRKLAKSFAAHPYTAESSWGFQLREKRREQLTCVYVERVERIDRAIDPFGKVSEFSIVEYRSVDFTVRSSFPGVELRNPPRSCGELWRRLAEYSDHSITVADVRADVSSWVQCVERRSRAIVTSLQFGGVALTADAAASIRVEGTRDVRVPADRLIGKRAREITGAMVRFEAGQGEVIADIRGPGRVTVSAPSMASAVEILRDSLGEAARNYLKPK